MRMRRLLRLIAFAAVGAGLAACALVSSLNDFSAVTLDASASITKPVDARADAPAVTEDETGSDDASDAGPPPGEDGTPPGDDADAETDAPERDDADAEEVADVVDSEPPVDASDGGSSPDASDGCTPVIHMNGVGQNYTDCTSRGTYNTDQAAKACAAANQGCVQNNLICIGGPTVECTQNASSCVCWSYTGATAGHVVTSKGGALCACPAMADPAWN